MSLSNAERFKTYSASKAEKAGEVVRIDMGTTPRKGNWTVAIKMSTLTQQVLSSNPIL